MADAKVIPFDEDTRTRRGAPRSRGRAAARGKAGGDTGNAVAALPVDERTARAADGADAVQGAVTASADTPGAGGADGASEAAQTAPQGAEGHPGTTSGGAPGGLGGPLAAVLGSAADRLLGAPWERRVAHGLAFLRRRITGDYEVDDFGYDEELTEQVLMSLLRPLYESYFRVEVKGIENIPAEGGALVVANHSGTLPMDGLMMQVAVHDHHPAGRHLRLLAADLVFMLPLVNELARKAGHTLACAEDAQLLLERGEVVGVMPEGFKGLGKPFSERYKLQRFGRGGFVATALKTGVPIVPCSIVGAEEIYPMIGNAKTVARLLGVPYVPVTPTFPWLGPLGMVPLPTKWTIQFGEPIPTDGYAPEAAEDPMLVFNLTDQVRETIQHTLYKLLVQRRSVFF
ncbi:lysophospholipid acyltransferase family protein [Actinacidiphila glaucinigra]|uniref:lysophospholipid acyltransferase family protein n=1 Tax=Actinacidiphila glaucinigra TaxID=235986 RepID=UPI0036DFC70D